MVDKKRVEHILADVDKILDKASFGKKKVESFRETISILKGSNNKFSDEVKALISSSYDDLRAITTDICNDVKSFSIANLSEFIKDLSKIESYQHKKDYIINKCDYIVKGDDWKEFSNYLSELANVFNKIEERKNILEKVENLVDVHHDIYDKTTVLFSNIKSDLKEVLEEEDKKE